MAASFPPGGGTGVSVVKPTSYGQPVQPTALVTASTLATALQATSMPAFAPRTGPMASEVIVSPSELFQPFLGAGAAITDSAATMLMSLDQATRTAFLTEMFGTNGASVVRICLGTGGFSSQPEQVYLDDSTDLGFSKLAAAIAALDGARVIPVLQEILAINPRVRVHAANWSPPSWMKASATIKGGAMNETNANFAALANFFVQAIQTFASFGIPIHYVSPQNEPTVSQGTYATCTWTAAGLNTFVKNYLGPAFDIARISTKILVGDDNWSAFATYLTTCYTDTVTAGYATGGCHHDYAGNPPIMQQFQRAYPGKEMHSTEHRSLSTDTIAATLAYMSNYVIEELRNGTVSKCYWNLALNESGGPQTSGSTGRRGVVTINSTTFAITRNPEFYILAHLCTYLKPGARRCASTSYGLGNLQTAAIANPDGSVFVFLYNATAATITVPITDAGSGLTSSLSVPAGSIATVAWDGSTATTAGTITGPSAPSLTGGVAGNKKARLTWTAPTSGLPIGGYRVMRGTAAGGTKSLVAVLPSSATSFVDTAALAGTTYYYTVVAYAGTASAASAEVSTAAQIFVYGAPTKPNTLGAFTYQPKLANAATGGTWSATGLTGSNLAINASTGAITGTGVAGTYNVVVTYTDPSSNAGSQSFTLVVGTTATYTTQDATSSANTGTLATSVSASHTLGTGANLIMVGLGMNVVAQSPINYPSATTVTVTDGGGNVYALSRVARAQTSGSTGGTDRMCELWSLTYDACVAAYGQYPTGTVTITASTPQGTGSSQPATVMGAVSYTVAPGSPLGTAVTNVTTTSGGATSATATVASAANGLIFGASSARASTAMTLGTGETAVVNGINSTNTNGAVFTQANASTAPASSATITTADQFALAAVPIAPM